MKRALPLLFASATALASTDARAVDCASLSNVLYITGSSAAKPVISQLATVLAAESPVQTLVYQGQGSCTGVDAILNGTPAMGAASYWDTSGTEQMCDLAASGQIVDVGISDVFPSSCFMLPNGLPSNIGEFHGPVQSMLFVVPAASQQQSISAEAAYFVYGFGSNSGVAPWTDETLIFQRNASSGTEQMISAAIGVPATKWHGVANSSSGALLTGLEMSMDPEATIGILSADVVQENTSVVKPLAYQHYEQRCGYLPDASPTSNEKQNTRDGHYAIWGPIHLLTLVNGQGYPMNPLAGDVVGYFTGTKMLAGVDLIAFEASTHVIPQCAMKVSRDEEMGPLSSYAPEGACGCYYEYSANGSTSCAPCKTTTDCPADAPFCRYGYCEAM